MRQVLHLMKPARLSGEGGPTGQDETGRRVAPEDTPQHASELKPGASGPGFSYRSDARRATWGEVPSLFAQEIASTGVLNP
jgi:hypothetical protein